MLSCLIDKVLICGLIWSVSWCLSLCIRIWTGLKEVCGSELIARFLGDWGNATDKQKMKVGHHFHCLRRCGSSIVSL